MGGYYTEAVTSWEDITLRLLPRGRILRQGCYLVGGYYTKAVNLLGGFYTEAVTSWVDITPRLMAERGRKMVSISL